MHLKKNAFPKNIHTVITTLLSGQLQNDCVNEKEIESGKIEI